MKLIPIIQKVNRIKKDISENQTLISTILPILRYLDWDIFNENRVIFEDVTTTKKRVDITLVFEDNTKFIIEAKRLSHKLSVKDFEQLTLYINSDDSVNFGILTNGIDYWIADNKGEGLENKKIYGFNIFEMTECDLSILKLFFSFHAPYKLKDLGRYINYIQTGIDFGDKECEKVLDISNFEATKELKFKSSEELQITNSQRKPIFEKSNFQKSTPPVFQEDEEDVKENLFDQVDESDENLESSEEIKKNDLEVQKVDNFQKPKIEDNETPKIEKTEVVKTEEKKIENHVQPQNIEIFKAENLKGNIEFFELLERNRAKIFFNGEYHIISEENFSTLFVQLLKYLLKKLKSYPALLSKVVSHFEFIVIEKDRNQKSAKYEPIGENLFYNVNINNYTKLKNIESLLKYVHEHFE
jgi:hypothetical protein